MSDHRFRRDAVICAAVLSLLAATLVYGRSTHSWRLLFERGSDTFAARSIDGAMLDAVLFLPGTGQAVSGRLSELAVPGRSDHLLELGVAPGPRFRVAAIDESGDATWSATVPPRARERSFRLLVPAAGGDSPVRFEVSHRGRRDLEMRSARLHELHPAQRLAGRLIAGVGLLTAILFMARHRSRAGRYLRTGPAKDLDPATRAWDRLVGLAIFLACFFVFWTAPVTQIIDSRYSTAVSQQILTEGTLALPETIVSEGRAGLPHGLQRINGTIYHYYAQAVHLLNVPFVAAFSAAGFEPLTADGRFLRHHEVRILRFTAAIQAAVLCVFLFALARLYLGPASSAPLALVFAFGTQVASTISRPYWSHGWAALFLTAALLVLLSGGREAGRWRLIGAGSLLAWAFFCRPPMALAALAVTVLVTWRRRRDGAAMAVTGAIWATGFVLFSLRTFGTLAPPYFFRAQVESGALGLEVLRTSYFEALAGTLVSPSRGLFVYVPLTVLILFLAAWRWRRLADRPLAVTALGVIVTHWQLLSMNRVWWGGQSFGARLFSDTLPWFLLLAAMALAGIEETWRRIGRPARAALAMAVLLAVTSSVVINVRGATDRRTFAWKPQMLWDWQRPQFLTGLLPRGAPTAEDDAGSAATED